MKYEKQIPIQYLRHYSEFDFVFLWKGRLSHRKFHELVQNHLSPDKFWFVLDSTMTTSKGESAQAQKKHKFIRIDRSQILKLVKRKFSALLNVPRNLFFFRSCSPFMFLVNRVISPFLIRYHCMFLYWFNWHIFVMGRVFLLCSPIQLCVHATYAASGWGQAPKKSIGKMKMNTIKSILKWTICMQTKSCHRSPPVPNSDCSGNKLFKLNSVKSKCNLKITENTRVSSTTFSLRGGRKDKTHVFS